MKLKVWLLLLFVVFPSIAWGEYVLPRFNERVDEAFQAVAIYNERQGIQPGLTTKSEINENAVIFTNQIPLDSPIESFRDPDNKKQFFGVSTIFLRKSSTIEKRVHVEIGPEEIARMRFVLNQPDKPAFNQYVFSDAGQGWQIYESPTDIYFYTQITLPNGEIQVKEWIYAIKPNSAQGSEYHWKVFSEEFNRFLELEAEPDGSVALQRHVMVKYVEAGNYQEHKRIVAVVREALKDVPLYIHGEDKIGRVLPVTYLTREGIEKKGVLEVNDEKNLTILVQEPPSSYPLVIDPTISFQKSSKTSQ